MLPAAWQLPSRKIRVHVAVAESRQLRALLYGSFAQAEGGESEVWDGLSTVIACFPASTSQALLFEDRRPEVSQKCESAPLPPWALYPVRAATTGTCCRSRSDRRSIRAVSTVTRSLVSGGDLSSLRADSPTNGLFGLAVDWYAVANGQPRRQCAEVKADLSIQIPIRRVTTALNHLIAKWLPRMYHNKSRFHSLCHRALDRMSCSFRCYASLWVPWPTQCPAFLLLPNPASILPKPLVIS